jgi:intein/homing endonuclease
LPGTGIITSFGVKNIEEVRVGDKVLDCLRYYHEVVNVVKLWYEGELYKIATTHINIPLYLTPNHPIFVRKIYRDGEWVGARSGWVFPSQLNPENMEIGVPVFNPSHLAERESVYLPKYLSNCVLRGGRRKVVKRSRTFEGRKIPARIKLSTELMELFGFYVAEGHPTGRGVRFCFGKHEKDLAEKTVRIIGDVFDIPARVDEREGYNGLMVEAHSVTLSELFRNWFGGNAHEKRLPFWVMALNESYIKTFLLSYIKGDGCLAHPRTRTGNVYPEIALSTVSRSLAYQVYVLLLRMRLTPRLTWVPSGSGYKENSPQYRIRCRAGEIDQFIGVETERRNKGKRYAKHTGGYLWLKIKDVGRINYCGYVYNLDVAKSNSYTADLRIVHNCLHSLGFHELGASVIGRISAWRFQFLKRHPLLKSVMEKPVSYEKCYGCSEFARAHEYGGRVEHYKLRR